MDTFKWNFRGGGITAYVYHKIYNKQKNICDRNKLYLNLVSYWLTNKIAGKSMHKFLLENNIKNIAIYGMGSMGELFYEELENTNIGIQCFVDKKADGLFVGIDNIPLINIKELISQKQIDAIIITPIAYYDDIVKDIMQQRCTTKIISLEEIIYNMR